jgi:hypothetical protein
MYPGVEVGSLTVRSDAIPHIGLDEEMYVSKQYSKYPGIRTSHVFQPQYLRFNANQHPGLEPMLSSWAERPRGFYAKIE